jgi:hypothetical protein
MQENAIRAFYLAIENLSTSTKVNMTSFRRQVCTLFVSLVLALSATAQQPKPDDDLSHPIPALSKSIVFINLTVTKQGRRVPGHGTGFLIAVSDSRLAKGQGFLYLVTNRHVAEAREDCVGLPIVETSVRVNLKNPENGKHWKDIPMSDTLRWVYPDDDAVDLAVVPIVLDSQVYDFKSIPAEFLFDPDANSVNTIEVGDKVVFAGFFQPFTGVDQIEPIVREGILAMMPDGPMVSTLCKPTRVYLADAHAIPGNSGSPMFITPKITLGGALVLNGAFPYMLLGVVSGFMFEDHDMTLRATTDWTGTFHANSGISTVVPARELRKLLDGPTLKGLRERGFAPNSH